VQYNPSPYVYLTNVVNGFAYSDPLHDPKLVNKEGNVVENSTPVLQIKPVNIPEAQFDNIRIRWNDRSDRIRLANTNFSGSRTNYAGEGYTLNGDVVRDDDGNFIEFRFQFGPNIYTDGTHNRNWTWVEG